jgi:hypothetical protein
LNISDWRFSLLPGTVRGGGKTNPLAVKATNVVQEIVVVVATETSKGGFCSDQGRLSVDAALPLCDAEPHRTLIPAVGHITGRRG